MHMELSFCLMSQCGISWIYHMPISCKYMGINGETLQLRAVYKKPYFVLQVTQESVSGTTSHMRTSE